MAKKYVCYFIILLSALLTLSALLFSRAWFSSHESWRYFVLLDQFKKSFLCGNIYPRWLPDLYGGYGYPIFLFYQPGFFFLGLLFSFLPGYPLLVFYFLIFFLFILGSICVFEIAFIIIKENLGALFAALMFLLTPYIYVNLFVRGDLSELTAMLLTPVPFYFLLKFIQILENTHQVSYKNLTLLVLSFGLVIISHPATALFYVPAFGLLAILQAKGLKYPKIYLVNLFVAMLLALLWTSAYWLPLFQMSQYVSGQRLIEDYYRASGHVVYLGQLFSRFWGFGTSNFSGHDGMPFPLGAIHFMVAFLGFFLGFKNRLIRNSFFIYVALIFIMTPGCTILWDRFLLFRYVQFPWRILSVTAIFQVMGGLGFVLYLKNQKKTLMKLLLCAVIGLTVFWEWPAFKAGGRVDFQKGYFLFLRNIRAGFHTFAVKWEYTPRNGAERVIALGPRGNGRPLVETELKKKIMYLKGHSQFKLHFKAELVRVGTITINQIYLPDWKIVVNNKNLDQKYIKGKIGPDARIRIGPLPPGTYEVVAYYKGPPYSSYRVAIVMILVVSLILAVFSYNKRAL